MEEVRKITIQFDNRKKINTYLGPDNRIGDCYWVYVSYHIKKYFCLVEKDGRPITPLLEQELISYFSTNDHNDICIELRKKEDRYYTILESGLDGIKSFKVYVII